MGVSDHVGLNKFPKQGEFLNCLVQVSFNYEFGKAVTGMVVRDDIEEPFLTIIRLYDGRHVMGTECLYSTQRSFRKEKDSNG